MRRFFLVVYHLPNSKYDVDLLEYWCIYIHEGMPAFQSIHNRMMRRNNEEFEFKDHRLITDVVEISSSRYVKNKDFRNYFYCTDPLSKLTEKDI